MFDTTEKAFDDIPGPIQHAVIATLGLPVRTRRDYGRRTRSGDTLHKGVRVIGLVSDDRAGPQFLNQFLRARNIGNLSLRGNQPQGRPASSTARYNLVISPPRERPSACGPFFCGLRTNAGVRAR